MFQLLLSQIKAGDLAGQLKVQPETKFRYELPYIKQLPSGLLINDPYLNTLIHEKNSLSSSDCEPHRPDSTVTLPQVVYLRQFHAARYIDHLIEDARPSLWTTVCQGSCGDDSFKITSFVKFTTCERLIPRRHD